jgi:hypothetical protein
MGIKANKTTPSRNKKEFEDKDINFEEISIVN